MRSMSFALTTEQIASTAKTVTRRMGWAHLRVGDLVCPVEKCMGLKSGEKVKPLKSRPIRIVSIRTEPLSRMITEPLYGAAECRKEGFPGMDPAAFVQFFCATHKNCTPESEVRRIEFEYLEKRISGRNGFLPREKESLVVNGIIFRDIDYAGLSLAESTGTEQVVAIGWHRPGIVLQTMKEMAGNHLVGWIEKRMLWYQYWFPSPDKSDTAPYSWSALRESPTSGDDNLLKVMNYPVTIIRHEPSWCLGQKKLGPRFDHEDKRREFYCHKVKAWYQGAYKRPFVNPSPLWLSDEDMDSLADLPAYCLKGVYGKLQRRRLLEWPTTSFEEACAQLEKWYRRGAKEITLSYAGISEFLSETR